MSRIRNNIGLTVGTANIDDVVEFTVAAAPEHAFGRRTRRSTTPRIAINEVLQPDGSRRFQTTYQMEEVNESEDAVVNEVFEDVVRPPNIGTIENNHESLLEKINAAAEIVQAYKVGHYMGHDFDAWGTNEPNIGTIMRITNDSTLQERARIYRRQAEIDEQLNRERESMRTIREVETHSGGRMYIMTDSYGRTLYMDSINFNERLNRSYCDEGYYNHNYNPLEKKLTPAQLKKKKLQDEIEAKEMEAKLEMERVEREKKEEEQRLLQIESEKRERILIERKQTAFITRKLVEFDKYKMPFNFGFESTWNPDSLQKHKKLCNDNDFYDKKYKLFNALVDNHELFDGDESTSSAEGSREENTRHLEASTRIINYKKVNQFLKSYEDLTNKFKIFNFVPSSTFSELLCAEGGGHIHVSYQELQENTTTEFQILFHRNLLLFHTNNPWVCWAFNNPLDSDNAELHTFDDLKSIENSFKICNGWNDDDDNNNIIHRQIDVDSDLNLNTNKYRELGYHSETIEFRYFIMPRNPKELAFHLELINKIYKYIFKLTANGDRIKPVLYNKEHYKKVTYRQCLDGLKNVCATIGLNYMDLKRFNKLRSLRDRYFIYTGVYTKHNMLQ